MIPFRCRSNLGNIARTHAALALLLAASLLSAACAGPGSLSGSRPACRNHGAAPATPQPRRAAPPPAAPEVGHTAAPEAARCAPAPAPPAGCAAGDRLRYASCCRSNRRPYGRAAAAVKAGFLAAADAAGSMARVRVIRARRRRRTAGVRRSGRVRRGADCRTAHPRRREDRSRDGAERPRVLVLNQAEDGSPLPDDVYALTLSIDSDAALVARQARDDGARVVATVVSDAPLQRRFRAAFAAAWERAGGEPLRDYRFDPNPEVLRALRHELAAHPADATLLAVNAGDACAGQVVFAARPGLRQQPDRRRPAAADAARSRGSALRRDSLARRPFEPGARPPPARGPWATRCSSACTRWALTRSPLPNCFPIRSRRIASNSTAPRGTSR